LRTILSFRFPEEEEVTFTYEGREVTGRTGETIASALHNQGIIELRKSGDKNRSRGLFCAIGKCSSCLMKVDGVPNVRTCITEVREGMEVEKQSGFPELPSSERKLNPGPIDSEKTEVLVIGSGPAGLRSALTAARAGAPGQDRRREPVSRWPARQTNAQVLWLLGRRSRAKRNWHRRRTDGKG